MFDRGIYHWTCTFNALMVMLKRLLNRFDDGRHYIGIIVLGGLYLGDY
jgi:hypothetical protein